MNPLLADAIQAHGGLDRWRQHRTLSARFKVDGDLLALKGVDRDRSLRTVTIGLHRQWASIEPFAKPGRRTAFTADRIALETPAGEVIAERRKPRASFERHDMRTSWDTLHDAYYTSCLLWIDLTTPFLLAMDGVSVCEVDSWREGAEVWRGLKATFPLHAAVHSREHIFYFGPDMLIRRHDYHVELAGNFPSAHYVFDPVEVEGIWLPTRRRAFLRNEDLTPMLDTEMTVIELSDFRFDRQGG